VNARARGRRHRERCASPHDQRGIALLVAVLLVALGTIVAAAVAYESAMTARRGTSTYAFDQAVLIGEGAEALAAYGLRQIAQTNAKEIYVGQGWDKPLGPLEVVPGVMLEASLEDLQGRFNINNLVTSYGVPDEVNVAAFTHLLELVGLEPKWTAYVIDWIDSNTQASLPEGAEDSVYMGQTLPYRTANRYITSISELLALPQFGRERYLALAPYITALPNGVKLNVCTASAWVLDAYLPAGTTDFSSDKGEALAKNRQNAGVCFPKLSDYAAAMQNDPTHWAGPGQPPTGPSGPQSPGAPPTQSGQTKGVQGAVVVTSNYFGLSSLVTIGSTEFNLYSLLYQDGQQRMVRPIQRSFTPEPRIYAPVAPVNGQ
jgi:general secretion pathway protein K